MERKVFCIGLAKTGTSTFRECMRILGYTHRTGPINDGLAMLHLNDEQGLKSLIEGAQSFDDFPWPYLYEKVDRWFPESLFVMTKRQDVDQWFRSLSSHHHRAGPHSRHQLAYGVYRPQDYPEKLCALYEKHLASARSYFKNSNRYVELCWEDGDGWASLCRFTQTPIPAAAFPIENASDRRAPSEIVHSLCMQRQYAAAIEYAERHDSQDKRFLTEIVKYHARRNTKRSPIYSAYSNQPKVIQASRHLAKIMLGRVTGKLFVK